MNNIAQAIVDLSDLGLFLLNEDKRVVFWNSWMEQNADISAESAKNKKLSEIFPQLSSARLDGAIEDAIFNGMTSMLSPKFNPCILPLYKKKSNLTASEKIAQMLVVKPLHDQQVEINNYCLIQVLDVSSAVTRDKMLRMQAAECRTQELHIKAVLSSIGDAVITTDAKGNVDTMNLVATNLTGWTLEQSKGKALEQVFVIQSLDDVINVQPMHKCINNNSIPNGFGDKLVLLKQNGEQIAIEETLAPIRDNSGEISGIVLVFRDVSDSRKLSDKVNWQAKHDSLTGLYNRAVFDNKLTKLVAKAKQDMDSHALLYLDLDQFKIVNDTCGHVAGDELLKQITQLLAKHIRVNDVLARLGGDEFGIQLQSCSSDNAIIIGNKIRQDVKDYRFAWDDKSFRIGVSIGIVEITAQSADVKYLLSAADAACYIAKENGRNQVHLYQAEEGEAAVIQGDMQWFSRIQNALDEDRFCLFAQTVVSTSKPMEVDHLEVLIRMIDEKGKLLPPGSFISSAERFGLMVTIDRWVIAKVFKLIVNEREKITKKGYKFAINLSGVSLSDQDFLASIVEQLNFHNIPAGMVNFEITETAAIANLTAANHFIKTLRKAGCKFSLDDFGSGLSSFAYLKNLPVDFLKIDGSFVQNMATDIIDHALVKSINQIGHVMNLRTVAEFVENDETLALLCEMNVDQVQGFGISKPAQLSDSDDNLLLT